MKPSTKFLCLLCAGTVAFPQSPEGGRVERNGNQGTLIVESGRPLDSMAITIAEQFGIPVNAEDPPYVYKEDVKDAAADSLRLRRPTLVPKGGRLEIHFGLRPEGAPEDLRGLLQGLVDKANEQFPFGYRLDVAGDSFTFVPTRTRDLLGHVVEITPLLDRRVTIPLGTRSIAETANLMTAQLSAQTGLRVSCCQGVIAGIPWGMRKVDFEAHDEPARSVLRRLIASELHGRPNVCYWLQRCDPLPSQWCFINLAYVRNAVSTGTAAHSDPLPPGMPTPANQPRNPDGSRRFVKTPAPKKP